MSLLNDMLNDLEKRSEDEHEVADVYPLYREYPVRESRNRYPIWALVAVGAIVILGSSITLFEFSDGTHIGIGDTPVTLTGGAADSLTPVSQEPEPGDAAAPAVARVTPRPVEELPRQGDYRAQRWSAEAESKFRTLGLRDRRSIAQKKLAAAEAVDQPLGNTAADPRVDQPVGNTAAQISIGVPDIKTLEADVLQQAKYLAFRGERDRAKESLAEFLADHPGATDALLVLSGWVIQDGQWPAARTLLASVGTGSNYRLRIMKARLLLEQQNIKEGLELLDNDVPPIGDAPDFHALRAALLLRDKRYADSVTTYTRLTELEVVQGDWWGGLAVAQDQTGDKRAALAAYRRVMESSDVQADLRRFAAQRINMLSRWEG